MTAKCLIKFRSQPDKPARKVVGAIEFQAPDIESLDEAIDDLIDHAGPAEQIFYTIREGRTQLTKGHSL